MYVSAQMPIFYGYTDVLRGTQTTSNGAPINYAFGLPAGANWQYSGDDTYFAVEENDGATVFNGDGDVNEFVDPNERIGGVWEQTVNINGTARQIIWDYTFTVSNGVDTWRVAVIDVDLNNDNDVNDAGEDGYFLIFPDGLPPANVPLTAGPIIENDDNTPHGGLGAAVVCFAAGSRIATPTGLRKIEDIQAGDLVLTRDSGAQEVRWAGATTVPALGDLAPIVIRKNTFGNDTELVVSPQHAVLVAGWKAQVYFGTDEMLVRAIDLLGIDGVERREGPAVTYCHILFDAHELVMCGGLWSESLYPGDVAVGAVGDAARAEIEALFPELSGGYGPKAAPYLRAFEAKILTI